MLDQPLRGLAKMSNSVNSFSGSFRDGEKWLLAVTVNRDDIMLSIQ